MCYYDHSNGILRSHVSLHKITVPISELDNAKEYSVHYRKIIDRKPYFPETEDEVSLTYKFYPVGDDNIRGYQIADAHNLVDAPVAAAKKFEDTFGYWTKLLSENVKPDVMMCGHIHSLEIYEKGGEYDAYGQPCDVVVGSLIKRNDNYFVGAGIILNNGKITIVFNDSEKIIKENIL